MGENIFLTGLLFWVPAYATTYLSNISRREFEPSQLYKAIYDYSLHSSETAMMVGGLIWIWQ